jgi:hypothetical protein
MGLAPMEPMFASLTNLVPLRGWNHSAVPASRGSSGANPIPLI